MSPKKQSNGHPFTSLRIIGERAQKLLAKAREMRQQPADRKNASSLPPVEDLPEVVMHISTRSIVRAAFTILAVVAGVYLMTFIVDTLVVVLLAVFVATVMDPGVR